MNRYSAGLIFVALGCFQNIYSSLEPLIIMSSLQVNQEPTIASINSISSFVTLQENNTDYFYTIATLTTQEGAQYNGILKLDFQGKCDLIKPPVNLNIKNEAHPLISKIGKNIALITTIVKNQQDRIRIYDPLENKWMNTIHRLPKAFNDKSVEYITGTENKWLIKICEKSKPDCQMLKVQTLSASSLLKVARYTGEKKAQKVTQNPPSYQEASLTPTLRYLWLIGKEQDKFFVEIARSEGANNTDQFTEKISITVPAGLNLAAISNFTALDDTNAFFIDETQKSIYSINTQGELSVCITTEDPISALGAWNDTLVAAIKTTLYKYVPFLTPSLMPQPQLNAESVTTATLNTPASEEVLTQQPSVHSEPSTVTSLTEGLNAVRNGEQTDIASVVTLPPSTHSADIQNPQPLSSGEMEKITAANTSNLVTHSRTEPLTQPSEATASPYKKLRNWITRFMLSFWNKIASLSFRL